MKQCTECGKDFEGSRSVCDACRKRQQRAKSSMTPSDTLFEDYNPGFYRIGEAPEREESCRLCGAKFKTTLSSLKFCSPDCQEQIMVVIARKH